MAKTQQAVDRQVNDQPTVDNAAAAEPAADIRSDTAALARFCAQVLDLKKMRDIAIFDVRSTIQITDFFVIATGLNPRQLKAACDALEKDIIGRGVPRRGLEGYREGQWVLVDFGDVVVHLFQAESRRFYDLELLWGDSPRVEWSPLPPAS